MTGAQLNVLEFARRMQRCHGPGSGMLTGRALRKRDAERCADEGLLRREVLRVVDGDGWGLEPERFRPGYVLTDSGAAALKAEGR